MKYRDIENLQTQLDDAERDALQLVEGLSEERAAWRAQPGLWSVADCLEHLAATNDQYLAAMQKAAIPAAAQGLLRRGPAVPGIFGRVFVKILEPPVGIGKVKAPAAILPRSVPLSEALAAFRASQNDVRSFLKLNSELDLAGIRFDNPFMKGIRFSLATALHVIAVHERRHLWQAWRIRQAAESGSAVQSATK